MNCCRVIFQMQPHFLFTADTILFSMQLAQLGDVRFHFEVNALASLQRWITEGWRWDTEMMCFNSCQDSECCIVALWWLDAGCTSTLVGTSRAVNFKQQV